MKTNLKKGVKFGVSVVVTVSLVLGSILSFANAADALKYSSANKATQMHKVYENLNDKFELRANGGRVYQDKKYDLEFTTNFASLPYQRSMGSMNSLEITIRNTGEKAREVRAEHLAFQINPIKRANGECTYLNNGQPNIASEELAQIIDNQEVAFDTIVPPLCYWDPSMQSLWGKEIKMVQNTYEKYLQPAQSVLVPASGEKTIKFEYRLTDAGYFQDDVAFSVSGNPIGMVGTYYRVPGIGQPNVQIDKVASVADPRNSDSIWSKEIQIKRGADMWFKVTAKNIGSADATEVWLGDVFGESDQVSKILTPGYVRHIDDKINLVSDNYTTGNIEVFDSNLNALRVGKIWASQNVLNSNVDAEIVDVDKDGINDFVSVKATHLKPGESRTFYVKNTAKADLSLGEKVLKNQGAYFSWFLNPKFKTSEATVKIGKTMGPIDPVVPIEKPEPFEIVASPKATIKNLVADTNDDYAKSIVSKVGEEVAYKITVTNTGNTKLNGTLVNDYNEKYIEVLDPDTKDIAKSFVDSKKLTTYDLGEIKSKESVVIDVKAKLKSSLPTTELVINDVAEYTEDQIDPISASASITVKARPETQGAYLIVDKSLADVNGASIEPGDELRYVVSVTNSGDADAKNVLVEDNMPRYTNGFSITKLPAGTENKSSKTGGANDTGMLKVIIEKVRVNETKEIEYSVFVDSKVPDGAEIVNKATAASDEKKGTGTVAGTIGKTNIVKTGEVLGANKAPANVPTGPVEDAVKWILFATVMGIAGVFSFTKFTLPFSLGIIAK